MLQAVIGQDDEDAVRAESVDGGGQDALERLQLTVHLDAQRLERPGGRVAAGAPGGCGDGVADDGREFGGRADGAGGDDGAGDPAGEALLPQHAQDACQLGLVVAVDDVGGRAGGIRPHAHVERPVVAVREAALRLVDVHRRDAEVEQDGRHGVDAGAVEHLVEGVETGLVELVGDGVAELVEDRGCERVGCGVAVDADEVGAAVACGAGREDRSGVAAGAQRRVDVDALWGAGQQLHAPITQDGHVRGVVGHVVGRRHAAPPSAKRSAAPSW